MGSKLTLTYDSDSADDGTGAQLQRIFGIYAISKLLKIGYLHSGIHKLIIHSLDPFQSDAELYEYLKKVNSKFALPSNDSSQDEKSMTYMVDQLTISKLARFLIQSLLTNQKILLKIRNPYGVVEKFPRSYLHVQKYFSFQEDQRRASEKKRIVLHVRRGSNGADLLPGELSPRMLPNSYYLSTLDRIIRDYCHEGDTIELVIITDVPKEDSTYRPIQSQVGLWSNEPRLLEGTVTIKGESFSEFHYDFLTKFSVIHGGDPIAAIETMQLADFLVMSRSSFSYIGGVLNEFGKVFYPPLFWHNPLPTWIQMEEN